jgi:hypothetical protein
VDQNNGDWQSLYSDALIELDQTKLRQKIEAAEQAIGERLTAALHGRLPLEAKEQAAIEDARHFLRYLKDHPAA